MPGSTLDEATFLNAILAEGDCGMLLDVFHAFTVKPAERQRHATVRTNVAHRRKATGPITTEDDRQTQHLQPFHRAGAQSMTGYGWVPEPKEWSALGRCDLE